MNLTFKPTCSEDYQFLYDAGVTAIFGPGTSVSKAARQILEILLNSFEWDLF